jgi:hypothetical protein
MAQLDMIIEHHLSREEAMKRVAGLLGEVKVQFADKITDLKEKWNNNEGEFSFSVMGFSVSGTLIVTNEDVWIRGKVPFAVGLFKGKIESVIRERAEKLLV